MGRWLDLDRDPLTTSGVIGLERTSSGGIRATIQAGAGMGSISAGGFTSNGSIAIGDQTTDAGLDDAHRHRRPLVSVDLR